MTVKIVEALPGMEIGKGFDSLSDDVKVSESVTGKRGKPANASGQEGGYSFTIVKGSAEFREALEVGTSASAGLGVFSASAKVKFSESCKVTTHSTVCILSYHATNAFETFRKTPKLSPEATELLSLGKLERFRERFGDSFVSGCFTGCDFCGIARIETESEERDTEIALAINASYGPFKASGKFDKETSQKLSKERIELLTYQSGGKVEPVFTLEELFKQAKAVASQVANGKGVPISVTLEGYNELELPMDDISGLEQRHAHDSIKKLGKHYEALQDRINDIEYVLRNPDYHQKFNAKKLNKVSRELTKELNKVVERAGACSRDLSKCELYTPKIPKYQLPKRNRRGKARTFKKRRERLEIKVRSLRRQIAQLRELKRFVGKNETRKKRLQRQIEALRERVKKLRARAAKLSNKKPNKARPGKKAGANKAAKKKQLRSNGNG